MRLISPTGHGIREYDALGGGYFKAARGDDALHRGLDFRCDPGQVVIMPVAPGGVILRKIYPYPDSNEYMGVVIDAGHILITLYHVIPYEEFIGERAVVRQPIGVAQDIRDRFSPLMTPHIHMEVLLFPREYLHGEREDMFYINPKLLLIGG